MTQIPAGWYPDPASGQPGPYGEPGPVPQGQRYWDGTGWTEHVAAGPAYAPPGGRMQPTTPDGEPLAGWWSRVAAALLDFLFLLPLTILVALPFFLWQWDDLEAWFRASTRSFETGTPVEDPALLRAFTVPGLLMQVALFAVAAAYTLGFWHWKQATPGKMVAGLRLRRRDTPGPLPWSTMIIRYAAVNVLLLAGDNPVLSGVLGLLLLLDYLWPLWDDKNQALHDKLARTNVVLSRRQA